MDEWESIDEGLCVAASDNPDGDGSATGSARVAVVVTDLNETRDRAGGQAAIYDCLTIGLRGWTATLPK